MKLYLFLIKKKFIVFFCPVRAFSTIVFFHETCQLNHNAIEGIFVFAEFKKIFGPQYGTACYSTEPVTYQYRKFKQNIQSIFSEKLPVPVPSTGCKKQ